MSVTEKNVGFFDKRLKLPIYYQIYLTVRDWIYSGYLKVGQQLPTEAELCETFSVSRITIRKAVDLLEREQLVVREQGRGTFVMDGATKTPPTTEIGRVVKHLSRMVERTEVIDVNIDDIEPSDDTREDLALGQGDYVIRTTYVRLSKGVRIGYVTAYFPSDLGLKFTAEEISTKSLLAVLEDKGIELSSADQLIGATLADPRNAQQLNVDVGAPLVRMQVIANNKNYRPVLRMVAFYRADHYQHHTRLLRQVDTSGQSQWTQRNA